MRLNVFLVLLIVASAVGVVAQQYKSRKLVTELERAQQTARALDTEWGQLQLEQGTWAARARVEKIARSKLGMRPPAPDNLVLVGVKGGA